VEQFTKQNNFKILLKAVDVLQRYNKKAVLSQGGRAMSL